MTDWAIISELGTAGGTLVLAVATFASVRSGQQAARVAERSLLIGLRPVLFPSRREDPVEKANFGDGMSFKIPGGAAVVRRGRGDELYFGLSLRNVGSGIAVIHGWRVLAGRRFGEAPDPESVRLQGLDLYIPPGDTGFWEGALRRPEERGTDGRAEISRAIENDDGLTFDLLYGDFEGGQRTISRFFCQAHEDGETWSSNVTRHWLLDGQAPRPLDGVSPAPEEPPGRPAP